MHSRQAYHMNSRWASTATMGLGEPRTAAGVNEQQMVAGLTSPQTAGSDEPRTDS